MFVYRKCAYLVKALTQFTKGGYERASKGFDAADTEADMSGKVAMVTGSNSGIGKSAATSLAGKGAEVHLVCRNLERARAAREEIVAASGNEKVFVHQLDMSDTQQVYKFARNFRNAHPRLNVLVNNAGCMLQERKVVGGVESNFATNTLGTYVLTTELMPLLEKSEDPRVITVSSGGMFTEKLDAGNIQSLKGSFDCKAVYAHNKRQQVILTEEWAKLHASVHFSSMTPGMTDTPGLRSSLPDVHRRMEGRLRSVEMGADTIVWLACKEKVEHESGLFYIDRSPQSTHLPLAWTKSSKNDRKLFMEKLQNIAESLKPV